MRVAAVSLLLIVGCGDHLETAPTVGVVLYNGQPLANANVVFVPEQKGPASVGLTGADGHFTLATNTGPGALIGRHGVTVQAFERYRTDGKPVPATEQQTPATESELESPYRIRSRIPAAYGNPASSGLSADVAPGRENSFTFELTGK